MISKLKSLFRGTLYNGDGAFSWTRAGILLTSILAFISEFPGILNSVGIEVPSALSGYFKGAALLSGLLTAFRAKLSIEYLKNQE
jgi:hypothetical protein